ncbi:Uncharacterized protein APZ42_027485 [Daphnia magna]|uniref:Uncharacterized protein n=1 Tax=Daphnia magna TaxID=35525 RepID=A0A164RMD3_9CRUS|nr:Uncharacterized protein APZ42_027485 [Daphnia magna]
MVPKTTMVRPNSPSCRLLCRGAIKKRGEPLGRRQKDQDKKRLKKLRLKKSHTITIRTIIKDMRPTAQ